MASAAQILANRSNAQKSTGPRTPEGKATAARNAVKHGLLAEQVVIKGEDPAQFECYREGMLRELAPVGTVEEMLAQRVVSLSWRLRRAERLQSAVFATVYRENADDIVLWPRHGLPIKPGPGEDEVVLGQVVMTDFARAQILDRLLVYERRIENSLYRTMGELRKEREARTTAAEVQEVSLSEDDLVASREPVAGAELGSFGAGATPKRSLSVSFGAQESPPSRHGQTSVSVPPTRVDRFSQALSRSESGLAAQQELAALAELGSFGVDAGPEEGANAKITPYGVTTNLPSAGNHGRDARATRTPCGVATSDEGRATRLPAATLRDRSCETNPISDGVPAGLGQEVPEGGGQNPAAKASTQEADEPLLFDPGRQSD